MQWQEVGIWGIALVSLFAFCWVVGIILDWAWKTSIREIRDIWHEEDEDPDPPRRRRRRNHRV